MRKLYKPFFLIIALGLSLLSFSQNSESPLFVNDGEKVVYHVAKDISVQNGTISDALQNVPGVKVDTEGNVTLRGVTTVEIWINDSPSHFDEESQKSYLQQTAATSIEQIEVITNPSARYTSDTDTGIINIITNSKNHHTQSLNVSLQANTNPHVSPRISYLWSNDKITFTANVKGTFTNTIKNSDGWSCSFDSITNGENQMVFDTANYTVFHSNDTTKEYSITALMKLDYKIDSKNDFSTYFSINPSRSRSVSVNNTIRNEYIHEVGTYDYTITNRGNEGVLFGTAGAYFQHRFNDEGHNLSVNFSSEFDFGNVQHSEIREFVAQDNLNRDILKTDRFTDIGWDAKVDYNLPLAKTSDLYLGFHNNFHPDNNLQTYDTLAPDGTRITDWLRSEHRYFNTNQTEGLVILQQRLGNFTIRPGITYGLIRVKATFMDTPQFNTTKFFPCWRPSLHLSYRTASKHNLYLSYTRKNTVDWVRNFTERINYSEESMSSGNPDLLPTTMDVFEGGWAKYWDTFGSVSIKGYFKNSKDAINTVTESIYSQVFGRTISISRPRNIGKYYDAGFEFNVTYRPNAMLNIRLDANVYDSFLKTEYNGHDEKSEMLCYNFRLNAWTKLWNKLELLGTAYYNSPTQTLYTLNQTAYGINCGLRADFFQNRLSVLLNANDIFNWNKEDNNIFSPTYNSYSTNRTNSRYVSLEVVFKVL
ncbi:MAG: outer membrane beta-barrel protein [Bacteroidales bacterium]|nr:outer membrane beta-barrel protein [Bacteroidales bacterium]